MKDIKEYKRINNLPKYDIGKNLNISAGRLTSTDVNPETFTYNPGYNGYDKLADAYRAQMFPQTVSTLGSIGTNVYNSLSALKPAAKAASSSASSGVGSAAGYGAAAIGAALGTYGLINGMLNFNKRITGAEMMLNSSTITQSKYGVNYKQYGGFDESGVFNATDAQNSADKLNVSMNGAGLGASVGSVIGSAVGGGSAIAGPIGAAAGLVLGGLGALLLGGPSARERERIVREDAKNTTAQMLRANIQNEAEAASQGLRNRFNATHSSSGGVLTADKGKDSGVRGGAGSIGMVHTSHGIVPGVMMGLAGKGESIYNPIDGTASVFEEGLKRVDNIPTGVPLNDFDFGKSPSKIRKFAIGKDLNWDNTIIFGNNINPLTGNSFADDAKPYSKILENIDKEEQMLSLHKHTKEVNRKNALNKLNSLADILSMSRFNCGKVGKYKDGKPYLNAAMSFLSGMPYAIAETAAANAEEPYAPNSYVPNSYAKQALDIKATSKYDPTPLYNKARDIERQSQYNINQAGGLSSGLRQFFKLRSQRDLMDQLTNIGFTAQEKNNAARSAYADMLMKYGADEAQRQQAALATQQEAYAKAVGAKQHLQAQARKNWYTIGRQGLQDWDTYMRYNKLMDLYDRLIKIEEGKAKNSNTSTTLALQNKHGLSLMDQRMWEGTTIPYFG